MTNTPSWLIHTLFLVAFGFAGLAMVEKVVNLAGYTVLKVYTAARFIEFSVVVLLFVIALLLRDIRHSTAPKP
jgi:hypothetical protein